MSITNIKKKTDEKDSITNTRRKGNTNASDWLYASLIRIRDIIRIFVYKNFN